MSLLYLLFRRALAVAALRLRSREYKELEIVVLRHELAVLRRQVLHHHRPEATRVCAAEAVGQIVDRRVEPELVPLLSARAKLERRLLTDVRLDPHSN